MICSHATSVSARSSHDTVFCRQTPPTMSSPLVPPVAACTSSSEKLHTVSTHPGSPTTPSSFFSFLESIVLKLISPYVKRYRLKRTLESFIHSVHMSTKFRRAVCKCFQQGLSSLNFLKTEPCSTSSKKQCTRLGYSQLQDCHFLSLAKYIMNFNSVRERWLSVTQESPTTPPDKKMFGRKLSKIKRCTQQFNTQSLKLHRHRASHALSLKRRKRLIQHRHKNKVHTSAPMQIGCIQLLRCIFVLHLETEYYTSTPIPNEANKKTTVTHKNVQQYQSRVNKLQSLFSAFSEQDVYAAQTVLQDCLNKLENPVKTPPNSGNNHTCPILPSSLKHNIYVSRKHCKFLRYLIKCFVQYKPLQ